jgi:flagellar biosynthesis component FlhA
LGTEVSAQLSNFNVLALGAVIVGLMTLVPGLPTLPFAFVSVGLGVGAFFVNRSQTAAIALEEAANQPALPAEADVRDGCGRSDRIRDWL